MHILFVTYRDNANPAAVGGDIYLWELARGLVALGHKVTFVCSAFKGAKDKETIDGVQIFRIKALWSLPLKILNQYIRNFKGKFDVVIEEALGGQRLPFLAGLYFKEPVVAVWHQRNTKIFQEQYPQPLAAMLIFLEFFQARLYRKKVIITPSKACKEKVLTLGFDRNKVQVIYDGIGNTFNNPKPTKKQPGLIICLGKLRRYKRPDHVIFALPEILSKTKQPCKLVIAGKISEIDKGYHTELKSLAEKLGVEKSVDFQFNISEEQKLDLLNQASLLVQPSPVEGFSIVVIEANRCGTPVVVSNGIPEDVVINGYNGLVYPYGQVSELSSAISQLILNPPLWGKISSNARVWSQKFTWIKSADDLEKILASVVNKQQSLNTAELKR